MTFDNLVHQINELAETQRDRGTYFEYLARAYFQNEPTYQNEVIESPGQWQKNLDIKELRLLI